MSSTGIGTVASSHLVQNAAITPTTTIAIGAGQIVDSLIWTAGPETGPGSTYTYFGPGESSTVYYETYHFVETLLLIGNDHVVGTSVLSGNQFDEWLSAADATSVPSSVAPVTVLVNQTASVVQATLPSSTQTNSEPIATRGAPPIAAIVAPIIIVVSFMLEVLACCLYRRKQKRRKHNPPFAVSDLHRRWPFIRSVESNVEIDGAQRQELEGKEREQELSGANRGFGTPFERLLKRLLGRTTEADGVERKELETKEGRQEVETVERPVELEA